MRDPSPRTDRRAVDVTCTEQTESQNIQITMTEFRIHVDYKTREEAEGVAKLHLRHTTSHRSDLEDDRPYKED